MTESLVEWLSARVDEDAAAAKLMAEHYPTPWEIADRGYMARVVADEPNFWEVCRLEQWPGKDDGPWLGEIIEHVARHDPARVLAEVAAKRRIIALHVDTCADDEGLPMTYGGFGEAWSDVLRLLALPYAGRDGYQDAWRPE